MNHQQEKNDDSPLCIIPAFKRSRFLKHFLFFSRENIFGIQFNSEIDSLKDRLK